MTDPSFYDLAVDPEQLRRHSATIGDVTDVVSRATQNLVDSLASVGSVYSEGGIEDPATKQFKAVFEPGLKNMVEGAHRVTNFLTDLQDGVVSSANGYEQAEQSNIQAAGS
jgi:hypothetical protein